MAVTIEKSFQVKEPVDKVWAFLSDPTKVVTCVPGAQITEQVDAKNYKGAISVKVGPSVTDYKGGVEIVRSDHEAYEIEILGKGQDVRGKGSASMKMTGKLRPTAAGGTEVVSVSELNVVGILAQMGGRVIREVSNVMFEQFMKNFQHKLEAEPAESAGGSPEDTEPLKPEPVKAVSVAFSALKAAVTRRRDKPDSEKAHDSENAGENPQTKN